MDLLKAAFASLTLLVGAVLALGSIEQLEQARSLGNGRLAAFLHSSNHTTALRAALAIGRTQQPGGARLLLPHTRDRDPAMRALAVYGLGLIGGPDAARTAQRALFDSSGAVVAAALDASDRLETAGTFSTRQEAATQLRISALLHAADARVRARSATTLEAYSKGARGPGALASLSNAYRREKSAYARWHIAWSIYRGYAKSVSLSVLKAEVADRDEVVRIEAARALGKRGDAGTASLLTPLTRDASWRVQEQAMEALIVLGGGKPNEHLSKIPQGVHTPAPQPDRFAGLRAFARTPHAGKFAPPAADAVITVPKLDPRSIALFTGPQRGRHPRMRIVTTKGNIYVELYPEWAPLTVENFMNLANGGYYDGNPWFRIVPDFVVQSGDPSATAPGVGYTTVAEENPIEQASYVIALGLDYTDPPNAHAKRDSAGSEFYITLSPQLHLDRDFSVFGKMIGGFDVLGRLIESDKIVRIERIPDSAS